MPADVTIDRMTDGDVESVLSIEGPTRMGEAQLREELARPWSRLWVARVRGRAQGPDAVAAFLIAWHVADELHVLNVATRADVRRRGYARALMKEAILFARSHRVRHVLLEVRRSNRAAIALYRSLSFFAMGVRARYYPDEEDAVEMVLLLDQETGEILVRPDEVRLDS